MNIIVAAVSAFVFTLLAIPFTIRLAKKFGLIDDPSKRPHPAHVQNRIVPRAGGLAIYAGIIISALIFLSLDKQALGIFAGISILLVTGLIDDKIQRFSPYLRLGLLFIAALAAVASGIGISYVTNPLAWLSSSPIDPIIRLDTIVLPFEFFGPHKIILIADFFALFWIVTLTQVVNWSKGVDGQMPGITSVTALTLGLLSLQLYSQGDPNQLNVAILAFITAGASFAFLIFNWHPAKIFPGFSGSTILAFLLAVLSILSGAKIATALLVLAIPTADFVYTFLRRIFSGRSPVLGDRQHLHHLLLGLGWSHQQISLFYMLGSAMLGAVALVANTEGKVLAVAIAAAAFFIFVIWTRKTSLQLKSSGG